MNTIKGLPVQSLDIDKRMLLTNPELVADLFDAARSLVELEESRRKAIESKASSLLAATGVSVAVLTTLWRGLSEDAFSASSLKIVVGFLVIGVVLVGLVAALFAARALRIRGDLKQPNPADLFRKDVLDTSEESPKDGSLYWRRYITTHLCAVAEQNGRINEEKARDVSRGQQAFVGFIIGVLILSLVGTVAIVGGA